MREIEKILKLSKLSAAEKKSVVNFIKGLTPNRRQVVELIGRAIADVETNKFIERMLVSIDTALIASVLFNTDIKYSDLIGSLEETWDLFEENSNIINNLKNECGGDVDMAMKKIKQFEEQVAKECEKLLNSGVRNQKEAVQILETHFPMLSKSMLGCAWGKCKEQYLNQLEETENKNTVEFENEEEKNAAEKIIEIIEGEKTESEVKGEIEVVKARETKSEIVAKESSSKLKVLSMVVQGENGTYRVCENGVELSSHGVVLAFENMGQLDEWINEFKNVFAMKEVN